jgi:effector-binding domain-containing protein
MEGVMTDNCELFEMQPTDTLSIRGITTFDELPNRIGSSYSAIMKYLAEVGEIPAGEPFVIYYNLDLQKFDVEIGFPVNKPLPGKEDIKPSGLPAGPAAKMLYKGLYSKMEPAYKTLTKFVEEKGLQPTGLAIEFYLNSPEEVPEDQLETRIVFPLKK